MPLLRLSETHASQVILQALINSLSLTICLGVIASAHVEFDVEGLEQLLPQVACADSIPLSDNDQGHTM